jgi:hypothetical protein
MKKFLFVLLFAVSANLLGDDHASTETKVFEAYFSKVKPGKIHRFREIAHKYWFPTDEAVKRLAVPIELTTGYWDHVVLFYRTEGFKKLNHTDKVSLKWVENANKRLGESERGKLEEEFHGLVVDSQTQLFTLVGDLPKLTPKYYNLNGQYSPVYSYFTKFKTGSNPKAFEMMDEIAEMSGESPVVFRAISGDIDQISIWPVSDGFSRVNQGLSYEMKEFIESPLGSSFFGVVEDLGLQIGSVRWKWK